MSKILVDCKVLEQALEALDKLYLPGELERVNAAITALRAALEQPKQEPAAWLLTGGSDVYLASEFSPDSEHEQEWTPLYAGPSRRETEQEPVALWHRSGDGYAPVTVEQSHPPEPLTVDEALAQGWRRFYARTEGREPKA